MKKKQLSLDDDVMNTLVYIGSDGKRYMLDEGGRNLYVNGMLITPYDTARGVKFIGFNDIETLDRLLHETLKNMGFDTRRGKEHPFTRAFHKNRNAFFKATYEACTKGCALKKPFEWLVRHIDQRTSIIAVNKKIGIGYYTVPIIDYDYADREISDISADVVIPQD